MRPIGVRQNGSFALNAPATDSVNRAVFSSAGSTAKAIPVPSQAGYVFFSADCNFTAAYSTAAASQTAVYGSTNSTDGTAHELNPSVRFIGKGRYSEISVISPTSGIVTAAFANNGST
jgi:hypothetical protein